MEFITDRLILRPWKMEDAEDLYMYAKDPKVGLIAGWNPHTSIENSLEIIKTVFNADETYAICLKENNKPIGCVGLMIGKESSFDLPNTQAELGYWLGVPFWGHGITTEASKEIVRHGFEDLKLDKIWCGYFDENTQSKRVQEKCGFKYQYTNENIYWEMTGQTHTEHIYCLTKEDWLMNK